MGWLQTRRRKRREEQRHAAALHPSTQPYWQQSDAVVAPFTPNYGATEEIERPSRESMVSESSWHGDNYDSGGYDGGGTDG